MTWTDRDLREATLAAVEPPPRLDVLRDRVLARRAVGERVVLPVPPGSRRAPPLAALPAAAAIVFGAIVGGLTVREYQHRDGWRVAEAEVMAGGCGAGLLWMMTR